MASIEQLIQQLEAAKGDVQAQSAATAEFALHAFPEAEREKIRTAFDAAAVLRWFDANLLGNLLEISAEDANQRFAALIALPFVERLRRGDQEFHNVHESTRLGWRKKLARETPDRFSFFSWRAAACFADDKTPPGRIEWIYHLLCGAPEFGASELEKLDREWSNTTHPEDRSRLAGTLQELEETRLVSGRARAWALLSTAWNRVSRGEAAQLAEWANIVVKSAAHLSDARGEADARCLLGDALNAQGKLPEAIIAFDRFLAISQQLAERNPDDDGRQRELAVAHSRVGGVLESQGKLTEAMAAFKKRLAINQRLADRDPTNVGWQKVLAVAYSRVGDVLVSQGKLTEAMAAFKERLAINQWSADRDPTNAVWQRRLAVALAKVGEVLESQGKLPEAIASFEQSLAICRRLAEQDPTNARWQKELAVAYSRVGGVLAGQGKLPEAMAAFEQSLTISGRLAQQDPTSAGWQKVLADTHSRVGNVLESQGKSQEATDAFKQCLAISRRLVEQDPTNADWQRGLAVSCIKIARLESHSGKWNSALILYEEASRIFDVLVNHTPDHAQWIEDKSIVHRELASVRSMVNSQK